MNMKECPKLHLNINENKESAFICCSKYFVRKRMTRSLSQVWNFLRTVMTLSFILILVNSQYVFFLYLIKFECYCNKHLIYTLNSLFIIIDM